MAISATQYCIVRDLFERGLLPKNGALLAIGEAACDADPLEMSGDIQRLEPLAARRDRLVKRVHEIAASGDARRRFEMAGVFYEFFFAPSVVRTIDMSALLSQPLERRFDVVLNERAAEHVVNIAQAFKAMHECTAPGGLMIHESPFSGCVNQGFYTLQPTLFFDVAEGNEYRLDAMFIEDCAGGSPLCIARREDVFAMAEGKQIPAESLLFTVFTKSAVERDFVYPMQGYYQHSLGEAVRQAWFRLR
jgi:hypothetical protein